MRGAGGGKPDQPQPDPCDRAFVPAAFRFGCSPGLRSGTPVNVGTMRELSRVETRLSGAPHRAATEPCQAIECPALRCHGNKVLDTGPLRCNR